MATMVPIKFGDIALQIETATGSGIFDEVCGITQIDHNYNFETTTEDLPDCDDPDAVSFNSPTKISVGEEIAFQGFVSPSSEPFFRALAYEEDDRQVRLVYNKGALVGYLQGPSTLTALANSWQRRQSGTLTGTLAFTAQPTWNPT